LQQYPDLATDIQALPDIEARNRPGIGDPNAVLIPMLADRPRRAVQEVVKLLTEKFDDIGQVMRIVGVALQTGVNTEPGDAMD
jgi:hypothetical protein